MFLPSLQTASKLGKGATRLAQVNVALVTLRRQLLVDSAGHAVVLVTTSGSDVQSDSSKGTAVDTPSLTIALRWKQVSEVWLREHVALGEVSSILRLVPPWEGSVEAALGTQDLLECPDEVSVPDEELGVAVDVGCPHLMETDEILVSVGSWIEVSRGGLVHQTSDGSHQSLTIRS